VLEELSGIQNAQFLRSREAKDLAAASSAAVIFCEVAADQTNRSARSALSEILRRGLRMKVESLKGSQPALCDVGRLFCHVVPSLCHLDRSGEISRRQARLPAGNFRP